MSLFMNLFEFSQLEGKKNEVCIVVIKIVDILNKQL